jgi:UDP-N-acetylglucosamine 2-epimerase (non-hydrolysing)
MADEGPAEAKRAPGRSRRPRLVLLPSAVSPLSASDGRATIVHVVGTRGDAVRLASVVAALEGQSAFRQVVLHTGQDTDRAVTSAVLTDAGVRAPERALPTGDGPGLASTARALEGAAATLADLRPTAVVVTGASDAALGCALAASKLGVPVVRLEAGLREQDWRMSAEVNRVVMDTLADVCCAPTQDAATILLAAGAAPGSVYVTGSTAVDTARRLRGRALERASWERYGLKRGGYVVVTLYRPANVDDDERLARTVEALAALARRVPIVFPLHPRTRLRLEPMGDVHRLVTAGIVCCPPLGYLDFLSLEAGAGAVVTDSGTVQEEASALGVRCFTLGSATDRTITLTHGTNHLVGDDPRDLADLRLAPRAATPRAIPLWDGRAGQRVAEALVANYALVRSAGAS